jgi:hypothetical protein
MVAILAMDTQIDCKDVATSGLMDAMWFAAAVETADANAQALVDASAEELAAQTQPGVPGADGEDGVDGVDGTPGANCWDLNLNGENDPEEDVNQDGVWDTLDCLGPVGEDGEDGDDGADGEDGDDLTGVIARGWIPGVEYDLFPFELHAEYVPAEGKAVGILSAYRPDPEAGDPNFPTPGEYHVRVELPARDQPYTRDEIVVLVSVEARHDLGPLFQLFAYWEIVPSSLDGNEIVGDVMEIKIMVKASPEMYPADGNFSIVVLAP